MSAPTSRPDPGLPTPGLLVLGAPKAGTTTLASWWDAHPRGHTAPDKEVQYFNVHHGRGPAWYQERFAGATPGQVSCEATPAYLYDDVALDRIAEELPGVRLVVVAREPVARTWSSWCMFRAFGIERRSFEQVVADAEAGRTEDGPVRHVGHSRYLPHLRAVVDRFGRDALLVVLTDDLRSDRQGTYDALSDHVGVERAALGALGDRNEAKWPRHVRAQAWLRHLPARQLAQRLMAANLRGGVVPTIDPVHAQRLAAVFEPELTPLESWLGRALPPGWRQVP